ncbi:glycoside hydrolase family 65 protein [Spiroplasma taiwanense]|uniref:hypothetical protein n=1 Tax=Spiroplasma taiwanense TaxID=2145 RepID=UPI00042A7E7A|nr:hypothetical protein [Spiroplasma taiwanense]
MELLIEKKEFKIENRKVEELIFSISNGYIGIRGSFEEEILNKNSSIEGTYINAFYDYFDIQYAAKYTGYPDLYQRMMPLINIQNLEIYIDDKRILFDPTKASNYSIEYQMQSGQIVRKYRFNLNDEEYIDFYFSKLLSQISYELFLQQISFTTSFKSEKEVKINFPLIFKETSTDKGIPNDPRALLKDQKSFNKIERESSNSFQSIVYKTLKSNQKVVYATKISGLNSFNFSEYEEKTYY